MLLFANVLYSTAVAVGGLYSHTDVLCNQSFMLLLPQLAAGTVVAKFKIHNTQQYTRLFICSQSQQSHVGHMTIKK